MSDTTVARTWPRWVWLFCAILAVSTLTAGTAVICGWLRPDPDRLAMHAQVEFQAGRYASAQALLTRLERYREPTPMDRLARGQVAWGLKRGETALAELELVPDDHPLSSLAHLLAGQIEVNRGLLRAAEKHFQAVLAAEPKAVQAHRELVYIYNLQHRQTELDMHLHALSELDALDFDQLLHWGKTRNVVWSPERDCNVLARCIAADPIDRDSRLALADGLRQMGQLDDAVKVLAPLPASDPEAQAKRALLAWERGDEKAARRFLAEGSEDQPALARVSGKLDLLRGDLPAAAKHLRVALRADPRDRALLFDLGSTLSRLGDKTGAQPYLEAARQHDALTPLISRASSPQGKRDPEMASRLGIACETADRLYESLAWYRLAIARDPLDKQAQQGIVRVEHALADASRPVETQP